MAHAQTPGQQRDAMNRLSLADAAISIALMIAAGFFLVAALDLPPATLEPIGPAAFPIWASVIIFLLAGIVLFKALAAKPGAAPEARGARRLSGAAQAVGLGGLTIVYVAVMDWSLLDFRWATTLYAFVLTATLFDWRPARLPVAVVIAAALGIGLHAIFTRFFFLDLP